MDRWPSISLAALFGIRGSEILGASRVTTYAPARGKLVGGEDRGGKGGQGCQRGGT